MLDYCIIVQKEVDLTNVFFCFVRILPGLQRVTIHFVRSHKMFSANENIVLRQAKKRVVAWVEGTIPEDILDLGVNVMAMQVQCQSPGCVPLETAIIIVFPKLGPKDNYQEVLPGLMESRGGSYKTKVLKPMNEVTQQDVLEALPPQFQGGLRSMERLCVQARDVMLAQITQLFGEDPQEYVEDRKLMAQYLQECLQQYVHAGCVPPAWGEPFPAAEPATSKTTTRTTTETAPRVDQTAAATGDSETSSPEKSSFNDETASDADADAAAAAASSSSSAFAGTGNLVFRRPVDEEEEEEVTAFKMDTPIEITTVRASEAARRTMTGLSEPSKPSVPTGTTPIQSTPSLRQQQAVSARLDNHGTSSTSTLARLAEREHAPGIRRPGCPCCNPDDPAYFVDKLMQL